MTRPKLASLLVAALVLSLAAPATAQRRHGGFRGFAGDTDVPQYLVENISVLIDNAANHAEALVRQQRFSITDTDLLADQADRLLDAGEEALDLLYELQDNAEATNPEAVPALREAEGHLIAALQQADGVADLVDEGILGPTMEIQTRSIVRQLRDAKTAINQAARAYNVNLRSSVEE